jgi:predicted nuclease of restriction endonuclease-like (RecB) superfamily
LGKQNLKRLFPSKLKMDKRFTDIIQLIKHSRSNAIRAVNAELINLYWNIGKYISNKLIQSEWGDGVVTELAKYIQQSEPEIKGFSDKNIWRMKQFYETYKDFPKLVPVVREISWTHNMLIFSRCKTIEEKEFYLKLVQEENYSKRELDRQISASYFERNMLENSKLSTMLRESKKDTEALFKDSYVFEFLNLSEPYTEREL